MINLRELCLEDMEQIRGWRNQCLPYLRTSFPLTKEQQEDWYKKEICDRNNKSRFWAICNNEELIGYGGIENIQWENRIGEISLLIDPFKRKKGFGKKSAKEILRKAWNELNMSTIFAECYANNDAGYFWDKIFMGHYHTELPRRKYYNGVYYKSIYYSMTSPYE